MIPYWATNDPGPQMILTYIEIGVQMIPILNSKWSWTPNGPHIGAQILWSPNWRTRSWTPTDPHIGVQMIPILNSKWSGTPSGSHIGAQLMIPKLESSKSWPTSRFFPTILSTEFSLLHVTAMKWIAQLNLCSLNLKKWSSCDIWQCYVTSLGILVLYFNPILTSHDLR